jgi:HEAT repeat protein
MADSSLEQTEVPNPASSGIPAQGIGDVRLEERTESEVPVLPVSKEALEAKVPAPRKGTFRAGTAEHLAARRPVTPLNVNTPAFKERLSTLRAELTTLLTDYRWGGATTEDTANAIMPLLNVGPLQQWVPVLIPFLLEIDRAGNLIPVWLNVIEREADTPPTEDANPSETTVGKAQRIATLMLGHYKAADISKLLGKLATDPNLSMYATQSLVKQATVGAMQALITALKDAQGWAKVDIVEACLTMNLSRFYEILLASGLDDVPGLESYIAVPIFRALPLERYLRGGSNLAPRLSQQAALIFGQVIQDSPRADAASDATLPIVFERDLHRLAVALFEGARAMKDWQHVVTLHYLATLLGQYWAAISRGDVKDTRILEPVYACLPLMPEIERWMNGPGRDILLDALNLADTKVFTTAVKVLGELRDPRAFAVLSAHVEATSSLPDREQAVQLGQVLDTLGRLADRRAILLITQLIARIINSEERAARPRRHDNLTSGDPDIPGSIVLASALRAFRHLGERSTLDVVLLAGQDFDPYVRAEAFEALKSVDPKGDDVRSQLAVREALNDPNDAVVRVAMQLVVQFHDTNATSTLQMIEQEHPSLATSAIQALRALGGYNV